MTTTVYAGRFDFEDGGTYCGGWEDGKAHGHGVCTGPKGMGEFSGMWQFGYEVSGCYMWPSGNAYQGQWMSGKRHGLGVEKKLRFLYKGEWSQGFKGRYGVRISETSGAKYEGTWANGLQDGYGSETYADGGTYFGQMSQGMRNGYGIRKSVSYGVASRYRSKDIKDSMTSLRSEEGDERVQRERDRRFDENRGGFVLRARSDLLEELAAGISYGPYSSGQGGGNIMTNAINVMLRRRRNSAGQNVYKDGTYGTGSTTGLKETIMSKLRKQKSVSEIDEVKTLGGGSLNQQTLTSSQRTQRDKKSSFRSTSSNNSVDSRTSNRTAPAGLTSGGLNSSQNALQANLQDDGEHSFISQDEITDVNCIEIYMGEWKQDKRTGFGIAERSDGLKYEGEWFNNKKNGYGVTTFKDGTKEEGKYKNNVFVSSDKKKTAKILLLRTNKIRQKIDAAVNAALKAGQIAQQRADIALARAVNARTKSHAAELAAKQARADSEYARIRAHEVAPDFVQPGELKKVPEIMLDIDRMNTYAPQIGSGIDPTAQMALNITPNQFRKIQQPLNIHMDPMRPNSAPMDFMNWQQQSSFNASHSNSPPPQMLRNQQQLTPTRNIQNQYYDNNLLTPQQRQYQQHLQSNAAEFPNHISSNQLMKQQLHPSIDPNMLGQLDPQALVQLQQQQQQIPRNAASKFQQTFSFDEQMPNNSYYDSGVNHRNNLLQQAQSHSFNTDMLSNNDFNNQQLDMMQQQQNQYYRNNNINNPKRQTLKRAPRINDNEEMIGEDEFAALNPQQQHLIRMRQQQYSNSSGQESGIGSSVYSNTTNSALGTNEILANRLLQTNNNSNSINNQNIIDPKRLMMDPKLIAQQGQPVVPVNDQAAAAAAAAAVPALPRRKSLPSIVKTKSYKEDETAYSSSELNNKNQETFIIENGIKKRVIEKINSDAEFAATMGDTGDGDVKRRMPTTIDFDNGTPQLPRKIIIESVTNVNNAVSSSSSKKDTKRVSMPSIQAYLNPKFANKVMSREEANKLSSQRREELRKNRELEGNTTLRIKNMLKNDTISMFFKNTTDSCSQTDYQEDYLDWIKDVFLRNRLFLFIVLFNLSLAIWFLQLLK